MALCGCCGKGKSEADGVVPEGGIDAKRSCTDILCLLVFIIFVGGWAAVSAVALKSGNPIRLVKPSDYDGNVCGEPNGNETHGRNLTNYPYLYVPSLQNVDNLDFGICVESCPIISNVVCKYEYQNYTFEDKAKLMFREFLGEPAACWLVWYESTSVLWRCLPTKIVEEAKTLVDPNSNKSVTVAAAGMLNEASTKLQAGRYVRQGFNELYYARWVIAACAGTALIVTLLWVFLIRFVVKPLVYTTVLAILALFIVGGVFWWRKANELEAQRSTISSDQEITKQEKTYRAFAWIFFLLTAVYLMLLVWLLGRIRIAIEVIKEGSKAFLSAKSLVFVPPVTFVLLFGVVAWWIFIASFISSMGETRKVTFTAVLDLADSAATAGTGTSSTVVSDFTYKAFYHSNSEIFMQLYNLFGFFWTMNLFMAISYFVICSTVVGWYFSEPTGSTKAKHSGSLAVLGSLKRALRYHLGSLAFGSFIIAVIQFVRFLLNYMAKRMGALKNSTTAKVILCLLNCFLAYVERVVNFINKNAYIVMAIRGKSFCASAREALKILLSNILRVATTSFISSFVLFLCKVLIVLTNLLIGYGFMRPGSKIPDEPVESGIFPLFLIGVITFIIATMFMNIYDDCIDTVLMCFFIDDSVDNRTTYYIPENLAKLVDKYAHIEEMRRKADEMMHTHPDKVDHASGSHPKSVISRGKKNSVMPAPPNAHQVPPIEHIRTGNLQHERSDMTVVSATSEA